MSTPKLTTGSVTDRGLNPRRTANEDRLLILPDSGLFLVADGVGGHRGGQVASQTAVDVFTTAFAERPNGDLLATLKQTIAHANQSIYQASHELAELDGMASTLALVAIEGMRAVIAHVGDSRVYRFDGRKLYCETEDHSEVNDALRAGTLTEAQAANHPHRNIINRALGADATVEPDFKVLTLEARTSFLLCSDGITRHIPDDELEALLKSGQHPNNICARLKEICFTRGAEDNLTAVLVDCGERAYVEEATRPTAPRNTVSFATTSAPVTSRISVDFSEPQPATEMPAKSTSRTTSPAPRSSRGSLVSGLVQLVLLLAALAVAFYAGRNWEQISAWISGQSATTNQTAPLPNGVTAAIDPAFGDARAMFEARRYDKAREGLLELVKKDATKAEYHYWLGRAQLELKQPAEAIKHLNEAAKLNDKLPNVFVHLALAYEAAGDKKNALDSLRRATAVPEPAAPSPVSTPNG